MYTWSKTVNNYGSDTTAKVEFSQDNETIIVSLYTGRNDEEPALYILSGVEFGIALMAGLMIMGKKSL